MIVIMTLLKEGFETVAALCEVKMDTTEAQQAASSSTTITVFEVLPTTILCATIRQGLAPR